MNIDFSKQRYIRDKGLGRVVRNEIGNENRESVWHAREDLIRFFLSCLAPPLLVNTTIMRPLSLGKLTCDQAFFFRRSAKEKQRETRRSVGGQSGFTFAFL